MGSPFSLFILALLSLFLFVSTTPADAEATSNQNLSKNSKSRVRNALANPKNLIRGLNLSPGNEVNIEKDDASKIVEKPFRFPLLADYENADSVGPNLQNFTRCAGYVRLPNTNASRMFYYLFKSRAIERQNNLLMYLAGGPGFSSALPLFYATGPVRLNKNLSLTWNAFGWDKAANLLFVDQPTGAGFSYSTNDSDTRATSEEVIDDLYEFIKAFLTEKPEHRENDFYITGESYAAHYISGLVTRLRGTNITVKGVTIISPWINARTQFGLYRRYALDMNLITRTQYNKMKNQFAWCQGQVKKACEGSDYNFTACGWANTDCNDILWDNIIKPMGDINYYNIKRKCKQSSCYDFSNMDRFLNLTFVKEALGVPSNIPFVPWSNEVYQAMAGDQMRNLAAGIAPLLEDGIRIIIFTGQYDFICNTLGNWQWVSELIWSGQNALGGASNVTFKVNGVNAGWMKNYGPLTFLTVADCGHMVAMDQPEVALQMLKDWMDGSL